MKSHFAPDDFPVTTDRLKWAMGKFGITEAEVHRQTELWHLHEYKRAYSDWGRAWKRWFYQAEKYESLKREYKMRLVEDKPISEEERRKEEQLAFEQMEKLTGVKLR